MYENQLLSVALSITVLKRLFIAGIDDPYVRQNKPGMYSSIKASQIRRLEFDLIFIAVFQIMGPFKEGQ